MKSFNFDIQNKKNIKPREKQIQEKLEVLPTINIKSKLKNGGEIFLTRPEKRAVITISSLFLESKTNFPLKFTNFVDKENVSESTKKTLNEIVNNIEYVCDNTESVAFNKFNVKRLRNVLKLYGHKELLSEDNNTIFKVDGVPYYEREKKQNPFRIYLKIDDSDEEITTYILMFCDVYHLCLVTGHDGLTADQMLNRTFLGHAYSCKDHIRSLLD